MTHRQGGGDVGGDRNAQLTEGRDDRLVEVIVRQGAEEAERTVLGCAGGRRIDRGVGAGADGDIGEVAVLTLQAAPAILGAGGPADFAAAEVDRQPAVEHQVGGVELRADRIGVLFEQVVKHFAAVGRAGHVVGVGPPIHRIGVDAGGEGVEPEAAIGAGGRAGAVEAAEALKRLLQATHQDVRRGHVAGVVHVGHGGVPADAAAELELALQARRDAVGVETTLVFLAQALEQVVAVHADRAPGDGGEEAVGGHSIGGEQAGIGGQHGL